MEGNHDPSGVKGHDPIPSSRSTHGFADRTSELLSACRALQPGQMVGIPQFTLMDSMAAIKIMDVRMDSGMQMPPSELPESDRLPPGTSQALDFDPFQPLTSADVIWIMDRLLACEAAWHQGSALSQTLYTCLYFHGIKQLSPKHPRFQALSESHSHTSQPPQLVFKVLRAFLLATIKSIDIAWTELATKQHLFDGEDFVSDKSGLSLLETTDLGYVLSEIQDALDWIQSQATLLGEGVTASLKARLGFRKQYLHAAGYLQSSTEASPLDVVVHSKFARRNLASIKPCKDVNTSSRGPNGASTIESVSQAIPISEPDRCLAPSMRAMSCFDPAYNRKLVSCAPLRPIPLPSAHTSWQVLDGILLSLQEVIHVLQHPGFETWKTFFTYRSIQYQRLQPNNSVPYIRSLFQSAVCDRNMVAGRLPLDALTEIFFQEVALIDPLLLRRASRIGRHTIEGGSQTAWNAPPSVGQQVHYFSQRVAGNLVQFFTTFSQNRARSKRTLASKLYREWVLLSEEASKLGRELEHALKPEEDYIADTLFAATQHVALEIMTQITFSGFELDLYSDGTDKETMWWLANRIQGEQWIVCRDLLEELQKKLESKPPSERPRKASNTIDYLNRQLYLSQALDSMTLGIMHMMHLFPESCSSRTGRWPLDLADDESRNQLARATFATRVKWIRSSSRSPSGPGSFDEEIETLWKDYNDFREEALVSVDKGTFAYVCRGKFEDSLHYLEQILNTLDDRQRQDLTYKDFISFIESLISTCRTNYEVVNSLLTSASDDIKALTRHWDYHVSSVIPHAPTWTYVNPWIPTLTFTHSA